jgi:hypothetical protein
MELFPATALGCVVLADGAGCVRTASSVAADGYGDTILFLHGCCLFSGNCAPATVVVYVAVS